MARKLRDDVAGGIHHVFARGNNRERVFYCDADRWLYLRLLGEASERMRWRCLAYCLMSNHVHLLIETPERNLGAGMQRLHGKYARVLNQRRERSGHVFQGRYGSTLVENDKQLWTTVRYIARNPVRQAWSIPRMAGAGAATRWCSVPTGRDGSTSAACSPTSTATAEDRSRATGS